MNSQTENQYARHFHHWRNHEKLEELEQILDSDFSRYIDPGMAENIKSLVRRGREHRTPFQAARPSPHSPERHPGNGNGSIPMSSQSEV